MKQLTLMVLLVLGSMPAGATGTGLPAPDKTAPAAAQEQPAFLPLENPAWAPKTCTASFDCGDGNTISCTGNSTCQVYSYVGSVKCDGNETVCPNRCNVYIFCSCGVIQCYSTSGNCNYEDNSCNGSRISCDFCPDIPNL